MILVLAIISFSVMVAMGTVSTVLAEGLYSTLIIGDETSISNYIGEAFKEFGISSTITIVSAIIFINSIGPAIQEFILYFVK